MLLKRLKLCENVAQWHLLYVGKRVQEWNHAKVIGDQPGRAQRTVRIEARDMSVVMNAIPQWTAPGAGGV